MQNAPGESLDFPFQNILVMKTCPPRTSCSFIIIILPAGNKSATNYIRQDSFSLNLQINVFVYPSAFFAEWIISSVIP